MLGCHEHMHPCYAGPPSAPHETEALRGAALTLLSFAHVSLGSHAKALQCADAMLALDTLPVYRWVDTFLRYSNWNFFEERSDCIKILWYTGTVDTFFRKKILEFVCSREIFCLFKNGVVS